MADTAHRLTDEKLEEMGEKVHLAPSQSLNGACSMAQWDGVVRILKYMG